MLRHPRVANRGRRCAALPDAQCMPERGPMPVLLRRFDQDAAQMRVAGFGDATLVAAGAAGMFRRD
jgi:hypothetical protein